MLRFSYPSYCRDGARFGFLVIKYQNIKYLQGFWRMAFLCQNRCFLQILENYYQIENKYLFIRLLSNKKVAEAQATATFKKIY